MKKVLVSMLAVVSILFATSCSKDENEDNAKLILSEKSITFEAKATEKTVAVTTNQADWKVVGSSTEWIEVTRKENNLTIHVSTNQNINVRKGWVLVIAGNLNEKIDVTQAGADVSVTINPDNIEVDSDAGSITIDVVANDKEWTATTTADWVSLTPKNYKYELDLQFSENKKRTDRSAEIVIAIGETKKVISVIQKGILYYIFPSFGFGSDAIAVKDFETARKSVLVEESGSKWFKKLEFKTKSSLFSKILYEFNSKRVYEKSSVYFDKTKFTEEKDGIITFLKEKGFKQDTENKNIFYNKKESVQAEINTDLGKIIYTLVIKQDKAYETFSSFPYGFYKWFATKEEIATYEAQNGGTLDAGRGETKNNVEKQVFTVNSTSKKAPYERMYEISLVGKKGLHSSRQFFKNVNLAFYKAKDNNFYLTEEFLKLAKAEGFKFIGTRNDGYHIFVNTDKNTNMLIRASKFKENNYVPELEIALLAKNRNI